MRGLPITYIEDDEANQDYAHQAFVCDCCGWWKVIRIEQKIDSDSFWDPYDVFNEDGYRWIWDLGAIGSLKELDLSDLTIPIEEVKQYLLAKYSDRHKLHPRLFEETVASVFRDLGFRARTTAYSGDGEIDIVLDGPHNNVIGVQVKRHKNTIKVEQIRSLAGALLLGGYTKGIFVTTSHYQRGAIKTAKLAAIRGIPIDLIDSERFLDALQIGRRNKYKNYVEEDAPFQNITRRDFIPLL